MPKRYTREQHIQDILVRNPKAQNMEFGDLDRTGKRARIEVTCTVCGYQWSPLTAHLKKGRGCRRCNQGGFKMTREDHINGILDKNYKAQSMKFGKIIKDYGGNRIVLRIEVTCTVCDYQWSPDINHLKNKGSGCPVCASGSSERRIKEVLDAHNITNIPQAKFQDLPGHIFDFYLPDHNVIIEYDGIQHYVYPNYFHETREEFVYQQDRDRIKDCWARDSGIHLMRIRYDENLEVRLSNIIRLLR